MLLIYRIIHSPFGQVLKAIRDNEPRAISLGYRVNRYKLAVFVLSARWPVSPAHQGDRLPARLAHRRALDMSGEVVLMTLVGGMGTVSSARSSAPSSSSSPCRTTSPTRGCSAPGSRSCRASSSSSFRGGWSVPRRCERKLR
jgi:hypothetical protein